jgi:diguanylate cyclase (GGDEF)-like protein/PAS domain S-box-containing protein
MPIRSCYTGPKAATLGAMKSDIPTAPLGDITPETAGAWLSMVAQVTGYGVTLNDPQRGIVWANAAFSQLTGYGPEEYLGRRPSELLHFESSDPETKQRIRESFDAGRGLRFEILVRSKDGHEWWLDTDARPLLDAEGKLKGWVCVHADVTNEVLKREARKVSEQRISFLAYHDGLTGLENRLGLRSKLDEMLQASYRTNVSLAVLMIDLDRFKYVNDTLGHDVCDELLVEIARRLRSTVRACDVVARLGGDEFVLVLDDLPDEAHVIAAVQKLFRQLRGNFRLSDRTVYTTCSMGISRFPKDGTDGSTLLKHADLAMYTAKANGGDSFRLFESAMRPSTDRLLIEVELRDALERNELEIYYQPRIDTVTGYPTAVEALLRWHHPTRGLVLPGLFIPIAEETGLIESIGQWVLSQACYDLRAWLDGGGASLRVSVNLSPIQFAREELPERVAAALDAARLPADLLELEITETVAMRSPELAARHLARLRALGVSLAVDDFGTGHSSLARLKLLNVDCVKIDRSLVEDCTADPHNAALCRAAIALGLALGLEVVAEGVETQEQRQFLTQEHCSTIQGYLVAPPMPAEEAFSLLSSLLEVPRLRDNLAQA